MKKNKTNIIMIVIANTVLIMIMILLFYVLFVKDNNVGLHEINYNELIEKLDNKDTFILIVSSTTCSNCVNYLPKVKNVALEYKIKVFYIEVDKMDEEEYKTMAKKIGFDGGTPTTIFYKNGDEESAAYRILGNAKTDTIISRFKNYEYIK